MIPIEKLRVRAGLDPADGSKDTELQEAEAVAVALAEQYLDRTLAYSADYVEQINHFAGYVISLKAYPICEVTSIEVDDGGAEPPYHLDSLRGLIEFDGRIKYHRLKITYAGGYVESSAGDPCPYLYPVDLQQAVLMIFDQVYADQQTGGGGLSSDNVQSITINDVGTIRWGGSGAGGAGGAGSIGFIPSTAVAILSPYRREQC